MTDRLHLTYRVVALDGEGEVVGRELIEDAGSFTIQDLTSYVMISGAEKMRVEPLSAEIRDDESGTVKCRIEKTDE